MKRSWALPLLLFAATSAAWGALLYTHLPAGSPTATFAFTLIGSLTTMLFVGLILVAVQNQGDWRAARIARRGLPREEGEPGAAVGELHPVGEPLSAPFSGTPAVAYEYRIFRSSPQQSDADGSVCDDSNERTTKVLAYAGRAIAPCEVRTADGPVRIGTRPRLDVLADVAQASDGLESASRFVAETSFTPADGDDVPEGYGVDEGEASEGARRARADWIVAGAPPDLEGCEISESVVRPGTRVLAVGGYSPSARVLLRDSDRKAGSLSIESWSTARSSGQLTAGSALLPVVLLLIQFAIVLLAVTPSGQEVFRAIADAPTNTSRSRR